MLKFIKDVYGGIFWKVALSGLKDCAFKDLKKNAGVSQENKSEAAATTGKPVEKEVSFGGSTMVTPKSTKKRQNPSFSAKVTASGSSLEDTLSPKTKRKVRTDCGISSSTFSRLEIEDIFVLY